MPQRLIDNRQALLEQAVNDVQRWCVHEGVRVNNSHSDPFWMTVFSLEQRVHLTAESAGRFLAEFQLARMGWDYNLVARCIARTGVFTLCPTERVKGLAEALSQCNPRNRQPVSAASKICFFSSPTDMVFIWDKYARASARLRLRSLGANRIIGWNNYSTFHGICKREFSAERERHDFIHAAMHLQDHFNAQGGIMADRQQVPFHFIERRLLDKLMFWEGWMLQNGNLPEHA